MLELFVCFLTLIPLSPPFISSLNCCPISFHFKLITWNLQLFFFSLFQKLQQQQRNFLFFHFFIFSFLVFFHRQPNKTRYFSSAKHFSVLVVIFRLKFLQFSSFELHPNSETEMQKSFIHNAAQQLSLEPFFVRYSQMRIEENVFIQ